MLWLSRQVVARGSTAMVCQPAFTQQEYSVIVSDVIAEGQALLKGNGRRFVTSTEAKCLNGPLITVSHFSKEH